MTAAIPQVPVPTAIERKYLLAKRKVSAKRTKSQIYLSFSEVQPDFTKGESYEQTEY